MSTSATNRKAAKRPLIWLCVALGCVGVTNIYALFGHGVRSDAMDYMFLYPLLGGALALLPRCPRVARNLYNAGIATLTAGGMMQGILEIAGTASIYTVVFTGTGWTLVAAGVAVWCVRLLFSRTSLRSGDTRHPQG